MKSQFVFVNCQPGAENFLKKEVAARIDNWTFAFSRPGFVTFKLSKETTVDRFEPPRLAFARTIGLSFGRQDFPINEINGQTNYEGMADWFFNHEVFKALAADRKPAWHIWQRDSLLPGQGGFEPGATDATRKLHELIEQRQVAVDETKAAETASEPTAAEGAETAANDTAANAIANNAAEETSTEENFAEDSITESCLAEDGDTEANGTEEVNTEETAEVQKVKALPQAAQRKGAKRRPIAIDAIFVEPNQCWIGAHTIRSRSDRWPGGVPELQLPEKAISRAYLKMQEALRWAALPMRAGDEWIELGCAPGGASQALLDNGMFVSGVDPAEVDPLLYTYERFRHLKMRTAETPRAEFVGAQWLTADVNAAPSYTLEAIESIVKHEKMRLRGLLITLKLLSPGLAEPDKIAEVIAKIRSWGYGDVRVRQLAHNRREYCVAALKSRGQRRMSRG